MSEGTVEELLRRMQAAGVRITAPRRAVIEALVDLNAHPTADDLAEHVSARHASVHRSSVYRTLDALSELGLVHHVHLGHGRAIYHLTGNHEVHLVCEQCERVAHVHASTFDTARDAVLAATGFQIQPGHFAIPSLCAECRVKVE